MILTNIGSIAQIVFGYHCYFLFWGKKIAFLGRVRYDEKERKKRGGAVKILLFHVIGEKRQSIEKLCREKKIQTVDIPLKDYEETLGALAGITGMKRSGSVYRGKEFPSEMLVFSGMPPKEVDGFLAAYREAKIAPIGLKAILTPHNIVWNARQLYEELLKEHLYMQNRKKEEHP